MERSLAGRLGRSSLQGKLFPVGVSSAKPREFRKMGVRQLSYNDGRRPLKQRAVRRVNAALRCPFDPDLKIVNDFGADGISGRHNSSAQIRYVA